MALQPVLLGAKYWLGTRISCYFRMERDSHDYTVAYLFGDCPQAKELELSSTSACRQEAAHGQTVIA
jgi:hypothetical protein